MADHPSRLTRRQREVAALVARGYTNVQIARELSLTPGTVGNHIEHVMRRLGLASRAQVAIWAMEHGLSPHQDRRLTVLEQLLEIPAMDLRSAMTEATGLLADALGADKLDAFIYDSAANALIAGGSSDTPMARLQRAVGLDRQPIAGGGRAVGVYLSGRPYLHGRVDQDEDELLRVRQALGVRSAMGVPLEVGEERRGTLLAASTQPDFFTERDLRFLQAVSRWVGGIAHRAELAEQARHLQRAETPSPSGRGSG